MPLTRIPLRLRAPNASSLFFGRESELRWLEAALSRGPLALLVGPGGFGKTNLVLQALTALMPERRDHALMLRIAPEQSADQVRLDLAQLLVDAAGDRSFDIAGLRGDPEELVGLAIDLAEKHEFAVVLDDLHHSDTKEMNELVHQIAAYAHRSKWLCTTRSVRALDDLEGQVLEVGRLEDQALYQLAGALSAEDGVSRAVIEAAGSPWLLKQFLAAGQEGVSLSREGVLATIESPNFLRALGCLRTPLMRNVLAEVVAVPADPELCSLVERGLIYDRPDGIVAHDLVRDFLFPSGPAIVLLEEELASGLGTSSSPEALLESLRLHRDHGRGSDMVALLSAHGDTLFAYGRAPSVWALVSDAGAPGLDVWKLRCAVELGNSTVLASVRRPSIERGEGSLSWAGTLYLLGQPHEALKTLEGDARTVDALVLTARCLLCIGNLATAEETLKGVSGTDAAALLLRVRIYRDEGSELDVRKFIQKLPSDASPECLLDVAAASYQSSSRDEADALVERVLTTPKGQRALLVGRRALLLRARIRLDQGNLKEAGRLIELVRPFARGMSILRSELIQLDAERRLVAGELERLGPMLTHAMEIAQDVDVRVYALLRDVWARLHRSEDDAVRIAASKWHASDVAHLRGRLSSAHLARADGDHDTREFIDCLTSIARSCHEHGLPVIAADCELALGDAYLVAEESGELLACASRLAALGETMGSQRLLLRGLFLRGKHDIAALERLSHQSSVAPVAAQRARSLLHGEVAHVQDRDVLEALRAHWSRYTLETPWSAEGPIWGLNVVERSVWLANGQSISLAKTALLWRILATLSDQGGSASKESLIEKAWLEPGYNPLRHDAKLHVAIRKLRKLLGDEADHALIVTVDEGYRLGGTVRRLRSA